MRQKEKDAVHLRFLFRPFLANAGFDQDAVGRVSMKTQFMFNTRLRSSSGQTAPKNARDDSNIALHLSELRVGYNLDTVITCGFESQKHIVKSDPFTIHA
jgi:hypothetical protein